MSKIKFDKDGLIPMIIQGAESGVVVSLFYGNLESIKKMKKEGYVWRYSRSNKKIMRKGDQSGFVQKVVSISEDCDSDALLVKIQPTGPACHTGKMSCFGSLSAYFQLPVMKKLERVIEDRKKGPRKESYTRKLLTNNELLKSKLREELDELINFKDKENLVWEAADLLYFMLVFLSKNNTRLEEVENELSKRLPKQRI